MTDQGLLIALAERAGAAHELAENLATAAGFDLLRAGGLPKPPVPAVVREILLSLPM